MTRRPRVAGTYRPRALYVLPSIPDDLDPEAKNVLAVRNACATEGVCPMCRAKGTVHHDHDLPGVWHLVFEHERWCVVVSDENAA